jgi:hypothetical protein
MPRAAKACIDAAERHAVIMYIREMPGQWISRS